MVILLESYKVKETGLIAFKRLTVIENANGLFQVVKETDYGKGAGVTVANMPIKPYKTRSGAEKAMQAYKPKSFSYESMAVSRW